MAAAGSADKENTPPPPTSGATAAAAVAVAASRRHGYGVKSCGVKKRPSRARLPGRVPLRDITNLFQAISAVAGPDEAPLGQEAPPATATELTETDAVVALAALQDEGDDASVPAAKAVRYSLLKWFR